MHHWSISVCGLAFITHTNTSAAAGNGILHIVFECEILSLCTFTNYILQNCILLKPCSYKVYNYRENVSIIELQHLFLTLTWRESVYHHHHHHHQAWIFSLLQIITSQSFLLSYIFHNLTSCIYL